MMFQYYSKPLDLTPWIEEGFLKKELQDWTISHAYYQGSFSTELCYAQFNKARIL